MLRHSSWIKALVLGLCITIAIPTQTGFWDDTWKSVQKYWKAITAIVTTSTLAAYLWFKKGKQEKPAKPTTPPSSEGTTPPTTPPTSTQDVQTFSPVHNQTPVTPLAAAQKPNNDLPNSTRDNAQQCKAKRNTRQTTSLDQQKKNIVDISYDDLLKRADVSIVLKKIIRDLFNNNNNKEISEKIPLRLRSLVRAIELPDNTIAILYIPYPYLFYVTKESIDAVWTNKHNPYILERTSGQLENIACIKKNMGQYSENMSSLLLETQKMLKENKPSDTETIKPEQPNESSADQLIKKPDKTANNKNKSNMPENFKKMLSNIINDSKQYWQNTNTESFGTGFNSTFFLTPTITKNMTSAAYLPYPYIFNVKKDMIEILWINKNDQQPCVISKTYNIISDDFDRDILPQLGEHALTIKGLLNKSQQKLQKNFEELKNYNLANSPNQQSLVIDGTNNESYMYRVVYESKPHAISTIRYEKTVLYPLHKNTTLEFNNKEKFFTDIADTINTQIKRQNEKKALLNSAKNRLESFAQQKENEIAEPLDK